MQLINGKLTENISKYHEPKNAELAVVVIDEKHQWKPHETSESAKIRRDAQQAILKISKPIGCRTITIDFPYKDPDNHIVKDSAGNMIPSRESPHIEEIIGEPDFKFCKFRFGAFEDPDSDRLLDYIEKCHIKNLLVMGGNIGVCVSTSIFGGVDTPGFLTSGKYNVISAIPLLSPYIPAKYKADEALARLNKPSFKEIKGELHLYTDV